MAENRRVYAWTDADGYRHITNEIERPEQPPPLTLRERAAIAAMQGQIEFEGMEGCDKLLIVGMAVELADALIAELSRKDGGK